MAKKDDIGYVYIFTNESFREGWVKIGKTQNIKKRLPQLDNTSCPLPFDVYATLKTSRYDDAEDFVHDFISHFNQSLRIRPNREYFKVDPEEALDILYKVKKLMNEPGAEIVVYDEQGKKHMKQLEKKHGCREEAPEVAAAEKVARPLSDNNGQPRLSNLKTLPAYLNYLKSDLTREVMKSIGMKANISEVSDIKDIERLKEAVKAVEKKRGIHHTHSCALSQYLNYLTAGLSFSDLEYDALLVSGTKKSDIKPQKKAKVQRRTSKVWMISASPKFFDHKTCFNEQGCIYWKQYNNFQVGDTGYIYFSKPKQEVVFKFEITACNLPYSEEMAVEKKYYKNASDFESFKDHNRVFVVKKLGESASGKLTLDRMMQNGLKAAPLGPLNLSDKSFEKLLAYMEDNF